MVVSYPALSMLFHHFVEERPPKRWNDGDGVWDETRDMASKQQKANMRLILFPIMHVGYVHSVYTT